jgi:hypothetical protein
VCAGKRPNWSFFLSFFLVCFFFTRSQRRGEKRSFSGMNGWDGRRRSSFIYLSIYLFRHNDVALRVCERDIRDDEKRRDIHLLSSRLVSSQVGDDFKRNCEMNKIQLQVHERRKSRRRIVILPAHSSSETLPAAQNKVSRSHRRRRRCLVHFSKIIQ